MMPETMGSSAFKRAVTLDIPEDLYWAYRADAIKHGEPFGAWILDAMRRKLEGRRLEVSETKRTGSSAPGRMKETPK